MPVGWPLRAGAAATLLALLIWSSGCGGETGAESPPTPAQTDIARARQAIHNYCVALLEDPRTVDREDGREAVARLERRVITTPSSTFPGEGRSLALESLVRSASQLDACDPALAAEVRRFLASRA